MKPEYRNQTPRRQPDMILELNTKDSANLWYSALQLQHHLAWEAVSHNHQGWQMDNFSASTSMSGSVLSDASHHPMRVRDGESTTGRSASIDDSNSYDSSVTSGSQQSGRGRTATSESMDFSSMSIGPNNAGTSSADFSMSMGGDDDGSTISSRSVGSGRKPVAATSMGTKVVVQRAKGQFSRGWVRYVGYAALHSDSRAVWITLVCPRLLT